MGSFFCTYTYKITEYKDPFSVSFVFVLSLTILELQFYNDAVARASSNLLQVIVLGIKETTYGNILLTTTTYYYSLRKQGVLYGSDKRV